MREALRIVNSVRRRAAIVGLAEGATIGLFAAAWMAAVYVFADRLVFLQWPLEWIAPVLAAVVFVPVALRFRRRRLAPVEAALAIDRRYDLRERVTSAYLMRRDSSDFARAIQADAGRHLASTRAREVVLWQLRRPWRGLIPVALLACAFVLPQMDLVSRDKRQRRVQAERRAVLFQADALKRETERIASIPAKPGSDTVRTLEKEMRRLEGELTSSGKCAREAAMDVAEVADKFERLKEDLRAQSETPKIDRPRPSSARYTADLERSLKNGDLAGAQAELKNLQNTIQSNALGAEQRDAAARELKSLSEAVQGNPVVAKSISESADALKANNAKTASSKLGEAGKALEKLTAAAKELAQVESALGALATARKELAKSGAT